MSPREQTEYLCCQAANLQDQLAAAHEEIAELKDRLEKAERPWRGPDRKSRLERGWTPSRWTE